MQIRNFRNLSAQELEIPPEGVAIIGENAQGKSNFLESVYYLETFRSFRSARDEEVLAFGEDVFRVAANLEGDAGRSTQLSAAYQRSGKRKKVTVDGAEPERLGDAVGKMAAVVFSPGDVAVISEGPQERRRFLDVVLSLNVPGYLGALQRFRHSLAQRNASLKEDRPRAEVQAWDGSLTAAGAEVMHARRGWVTEQSAAFSGCHEAVTGGQQAELSYQPDVPLEGAATVADMTEAYRTALDATANQERRLRVTLAGPHRDDVSVRIREGDDWLDLRRFGSGGQRRTAALALRIVESQTIRAARGRTPLVLLDDVFAELDPTRSERVLDLLEREETGQVILTAPKEGDVRLHRDRLPRWSIRSGRIVA
jgi:DNA replication and repair protein RecF